MNREVRETIQYLLQQYLERRASPQEAAELTRWLHSPEVTDEEWAEMMEELMAVEEPMAGYDPVSWQPMLDELLRRNAATQLEAGGPSGRVRSLRGWWVAAAVVVLSGAGLWWWRAERVAVNPVVPVGVATIHDLPPGGNKAILYLSGGRQMVLDSANKDTVLKEAGARVASGVGRLEYSTGGQAAAVAYNTLTTPRGGQYQLTLADGTKVWLDAASSITYPTAFVGSERVVRVTGQAYFEVAKDQARPFRVRVDSLMDIAVLGTSFNIKAYSDEAGPSWATLVDGAVKVDAGGKSELLRPGQQVAVVPRTGIELKSRADLEQVLAWKNGLFAFHDADLPTVMRELGRWYNFDVSYQGAVPEGSFDGKIGRSLTLDQVLRVLTRARIHYTIEDHKLTILSK